MDDAQWGRIEQLVDWLDSDADVPEGQDVRLLRVLKIGEEYGEVAEALHGALGANPRKGNSHSWDDVTKELCDVAVTTFVALATVTPDGPKQFDERLRHLVDRVLPSADAATH